MVERTPVIRLLTHSYYQYYPELRLQLHSYTVQFYIMYSYITFMFYVQLHSLN